jgi:hypothetical protein
VRISREVGIRNANNGDISSTTCSALSHCNVSMQLCFISPMSQLIISVLRILSFSTQRCNATRQSIQLSNNQFSNVLVTTTRKTERTALLLPVAEAVSETEIVEQIDNSSNDLSIEQIDNSSNEASVLSLI